VADAPSRRWHFRFEGLRGRVVFCNTMKTRVVICGFVLMVAILAGCASGPAAPATGSGGTTQSGKPDPWLSLTKDMTAAEVRTALGEPAEVRKMESPGGEIWVYQRKVVTGVDMVPTRTQDIPYVNPLTGEMSTVQEPVFSRETRTSEQVLYLLLFQGRLTSWRINSQAKRGYEQ